MGPDGHIHIGKVRSILSFAKNAAKQEANFDVFELHMQAFYAQVAQGTVGKRASRKPTSEQGMMPRQRYPKWQRQARIHS